MSSGFSTAAGWLQNISGADNNANINDKKEEKDPIIRDLQSMKDQETRNGVHEPKAPRHELRAHARFHESNGPRIQPKPKFVAHKEPTRGKKGKDKASSNRLGGSHMA